MGLITDFFGRAKAALSNSFLKVPNVVKPNGARPGDIAHQPPDSFALCIYMCFRHWL